MFLRYFLDFSSIYIAAVMCFAPVVKLLKRPFVAVAAAFAVTSRISLVFAFICTFFSLESNYLFLPEVVLCFCLYYHAFKEKLSFGKAVFVFLTSALMTAVCVML